MASNKNMIITQKGLATLSRELISQRKFQEKLITKIGLPIISTNGIATSLDNKNYLKHDMMQFDNNESISINFQGTYIESKEAKEETLWSLEGKGESVSLIIKKDGLYLMSNDTILGVLIKEPFKSKDSVSVKLLLKESTFKIEYISNDKYNTISGQLNDTFKPSRYSTINIGVSPIFSNWLGDVNLNNFIIYKGNSSYYAPSTEPSFHFTKIMISNGNLPLTDTSTSLINNVYEFNVTEIKRTGGNLLLLAKIDSDVYLDIKEVGLYSVTDEGPMLFSIVNGLAIKKRRDLGYGLLFNINIDLRVVNTVAMPEIIVYSQNTANRKDFTSINRVHTYIAIDTERIIKMNATEIGYSAAQKVSDEYNKLISWTKNNKNVQSYLKINNNVKDTTERLFNKEKLSIKGNLKISDTGESSNFSKNNYAKIEYMTSSEDAWKYAAQFKTFKFNTPQVILNSYGRTLLDPIIIFIGEDNTCYAKVTKKEEILVNYKEIAANIRYKRDCYNDVLMNDKPNNFYAWRTVSGAKYAKINVIKVGNIKNKNGVLEGFSEGSYAKAPSKWDLKKPFTLRLDFSRDHRGLEAEEVIFSADKNFVFQISINPDRKLVYRIGNGTSWLNEQNSIGTLNIPNTVTNSLEVSFDGAKYISRISRVDELDNVEDWAFVSSDVIPEFTAIFGQCFDHSKVLLGKINLSSSFISIESTNVWKGAILSDIIYTKEIAPNSQSTLYAKDLTAFNEIKFIEFSSGNIINAPLFKVNAYQDYYVSIEHKTGVYEVITKEGIDSPKTIIKEYSDEIANSAVEIYIGIEKSGLAPLNGEMQLKELEIIEGESNYSPVDIIDKQRNLKDYYYLTDFPYSFYRSVNLRSQEVAEIEVLEGSLKGTNDNIDFNNPKGFSMCTKIFLKDGEDRVILSKINETGELYFTLQYTKMALIFTLYGQDRNVELKKQYDITNFRELTDYPKNIIITYNGDPYVSVYNMYINRELLDSFTEPSPEFLRAEDYVLTNCLNFAEPNDRNCVENILSFEGELSKDNINLINNLLDTNF